MSVMIIVMLVIVKGDSKSNDNMNSSDRYKDFNDNLLQSNIKSRLKLSSKIFYCI